VVAVDWRRQDGKGEDPFRPGGSMVTRNFLCGRKPVTYTVRKKLEKVAPFLGDKILLTCVSTIVNID